MSITGKSIVSYSKKHPVGVASLALCVALLGLLYYRSSAASELQVRLDDVTAVGERLKANISNSAQLNNQLKLVDEAVASISERTVRPDELAQNLQYFYKLENDTHVELIELRQLSPVYPPGQNNPRPMFISQPFSVGVAGSFSSVMKFLRSLENGEHFCRVNSASFRPAGADRVTLSLAIELLAAP